MKSCDYVAFLWKFWRPKVQKSGRLLTSNLMYQIIRRKWISMLERAIAVMIHVWRILGRIFNARNSCLLRALSCTAPWSHCCSLEAPPIWPACLPFWISWCFQGQRLLLMNTGSCQILKLPWSCSKTSPVNSAIQCYPVPSTLDLLIDLIPCHWMVLFIAIIQISSDLFSPEDDAHTPGDIEEVHGTHSCGNLDTSHQRFRQLRCSEM